MPLSLVTVEECRNYLIRLKLRQIYVMPLELVAPEPTRQWRRTRLRTYPARLPLLEDKTIKTLIDFLEFASPRCG